MFDVFCGIDVARETHHAVALDPDGQRLADRPLPNSEPDLVHLYDELEAHGRVLVVIDQLASIGAFGHRRGQVTRHHGRLPARLGDAAHRRPLPR